MKRSNLITAAVVSIFLISSNANSQAQERRSNDVLVLELAGVKWMLVEANGKSVPEGPRQPYLLFDKEKGTAGGYSGCNGYGGKYETDGEKLAFTESMTTLIGCDPQGETEAQLYRGQQATNRYKIKDGKLHLYKDDRLLLVFAPEKKKPATK
jgi:heat shock protein HslJ